MFLDKNDFNIFLKMHGECIPRDLLRGLVNEYVKIILHIENSLLLQGLQWNGINEAYLFTFFICYKLSLPSTGVGNLGSEHYD